MSAHTATIDDLDQDSIFHSSAQGVSDAAADARAHAIAAAQNVKDGVSWTVYKAAFGASFGVVFTGVFLTELLPGQSSLRRGLEDGAADALDAIELRKRRRREEQAAAESETDESRAEPAASHPAEARRTRPRSATRLRSTVQA
jgi:hypothetical protein